VINKTVSGSSFRRTPEESIVVIGDDSSMHVITPEELPWGKDMDVEDSDIDDPTHRLMYVFVLSFLTKSLKIKKK
jgi:hypothetical protein